VSYSSLWLMDKDYHGYEYKTYGNSWWFSPVVWDVLLDKYMHEEIQTPYGYKKSLISIGGERLDIELNNRVNNSDNFADCVCWELSNQQVFYTKDKKEIAQAILDFLNNNTMYHVNEENGLSFLTLEHIKERFESIANDILTINEEKYPYFIFKNTSVDDNVEYWFEEYDEEKDEYIDRPLSKLDRYVAEFVVIEDGKIKDFIGNLEYFED
jgi:hypothetical protein